MEKTKKTNPIVINGSNKYNNKDIAKWIRYKLKQNLPNIKCSVRQTINSIYTTIKESKYQLIRKFEEVTEEEILYIMRERNDTRKEAENFIKKILQSSHHNINSYHIDSDCSLTKEGKEVANKIKKIMNTHNWDNSDIQSDYFDVNYYINIQLGTSEKPFKDGISMKELNEIVMKRLTEEMEKEIDYYENSILAGFTK